MRRWRASSGPQDVTFHYREYRTRREAIAELREYIEVDYNQLRRHASLNNLSPAAYCFEVDQSARGCLINVWVSAISARPHEEILHRMEE
ncbi:MAG: IS3 family transposase [Deltaproteobacteria bacterium]|nr:IS3 family transposase [Deltaproteobacteria bacterium]